MGTAYKVYVPVKAVFTEEGELRPTQLIWEDGRIYDIDRIVSIVQAPALKAGGQGDRYTVVINGKRSYLFFERNGSLKGNNIGRWFVERKAL